MYFLAHNWIEFFRNGGFVGSLLVLFRVAGKTTTSSMPQVRRAAVARASPFRSSLYVHPTVLRCRDKRSRKDGTVGSLSLSPFLSLSLDKQPVDTRLIRLAGRIDACVHALSSQRDDWWENSISVVVIVPPSSARAAFRSSSLTPRSPLSLPT